MFYCVQQIWMSKHWISILWTYAFLAAAAAAMRPYCTTQNWPNIRKIYIYATSWNSLDQQMGKVLHLSSFTALSHSFSFDLHINFIHACVWCGIQHGLQLPFTCITRKWNGTMRFQFEHSPHDASSIPLVNVLIAVISQLFIWILFHQFSSQQPAV